MCRNHGDREEFRVRGLENLNKLAEFFQQNKLRTTKQKNFELFCEILDCMNSKEHLTDEGIRKIADLAGKMNRRVQRRLKSSETIRQT